MTIAPDNARQGASHRYRAMRDFVQSMDDTLPGKFTTCWRSSVRTS